jgi:CRP-like cAMP-binding protein
MAAPEKIQDFKLFEGLSKEQLKTIADLTELKQIPDGETLFREKDPANNLYILLKGKVRIQVQLTSKPETIAITILSQPGQLIGWSGLVPNQHYTAAAICLEDSQMLAIEGTKLMNALEKDCDMGFKIMRKISEVISDRLRNIQQIVLKTL